MDVGMTALHIASQKGQLNVTKYLISQGADVNKGDNDGRTALHRASQKGQLNVTKYLISQGADVNKGDNDDRTALHSAAFNGHLDVTKYLISQGAELNKENNKGGTAFQLAVENGHLDVIKYLVSQGAEVNEGNNDDRTALHSAAFNGHLDVTKYLISQEADVNKKCNDGGTALHSATFNGHLDVTKYLISQGAEVNKGNNDGSTALHSVASNGHLDVTKYLISQGAELNRENNKGGTAFQLAVENGHLDVMKYLVSQGAEVNERDNDGSTALHSAAFSGHLDVTKYLISQGAEINKGNNEERTPLHYAVQNGYINVVEVLLAGGARFDTGDINGHTPLQLSLSLGYQSIADLFIDRSNSKLDQNDLTDIHLAIQHGHTSTIEKLVSEGADLNVQSTDGQTCLHRAIKLCYESDRDMHDTRYLRDTNTLKGISNEYYKGELSPEKALVFYLLDNGAKLDVRDKSGNLPMQYAKDEVVKRKHFSRLPSLEEIKSYRDEPSTPSIVSIEVDINSCQEIKDHGVSMYIPPEAVQDQSEPCQITLTLLRDPPNVDIQDDESVAYYGIRCDPPNMIFHQPVKIRIPHSTFAVNPDQVTPDIVSHVWDSVNDLPRTSRKRSSSSPAEPPYCRVYRRHLELYIDHCAEWWVLIPLEQQVVRHQLMCTPYIPDKIERGQEFEVHVQIHADLPGIQTDIQEEQEHQSYHKAHRSVPFSVESKSGDVIVTCHREGKQVASKVFSLKDVFGKLRHNIFLPVTPTEEDEEFTEITITITQAGRLGVSRSMAFIIRHTDEQEYFSPSETPSFVRAVEEVLESDLPDIDVLAIAQTMTLDQFYDLGVALGFTIQQLDVIEYRRFHDREQAIYDMLLTWRERQPSGQAAKETFLSLMKSLDSQAEEMAISDIGLTGEIPDRTLLAFARQIRTKKFFEIGGKLGFNTSELQHIEHLTYYNRKDANIKMLSYWKASQTSGSEALQTLKLVWDLVQDDSKAEKSKEIEKGIGLLNTETAGTSQALVDESDQAFDEVLKSDLPDIDVLTIAQTMTRDQFCDLGVALGFTIQQLDVIEYRRVRDRQQAIYDMLVSWRERHPSGHEAKEMFISLMESLDSPADEMAISGLTFEQSVGLSFQSMSILT